MSGFLLDTDVVSMLSPSARGASTEFLDWLERMDRSGRVFLSVITIHEIEKSIALLEHRGARAKASALRAWLSGLVAGFERSVLGLDRTATEIAGRLEARAIGAGHAPGMADAIIAGIAQAHGLTVITRNRKHFAALGVGVASPEEAVGLGEA